MIQIYTDFGPELEYAESNLQIIFDLHIVG